MRKYILNTTYGEWSAGTEVDIVTAEGWDDDAVVGVSPVNAPVDTYFDVPVKLLTVRRNRTDMVLEPNRKERRANDPMVEARRDTWIASKM